MLNNSPFRRGPSGLAGLVHSPFNSFGRRGINTGFTPITRYAMFHDGSAGTANNRPSFITAISDLPAAVVAGPVDGDVIELFEYEALKRTDYSGGATVGNYFFGLGANDNPANTPNLRNTYNGAGNEIQVIDDEGVSANLASDRFDNFSHRYQLLVYIQYTNGTPQCYFYVNGYPTRGDVMPLTMSGTTRTSIGPFVTDGMCIFNWRISNSPGFSANGAMYRKAMWYRNTTTQRLSGSEIAQAAKELYISGESSLLPFDLDEGCVTNYNVDATDYANQTVRNQIVHVDKNNPLVPWGVGAPTVQRRVGFEFASIKSWDNNVWTFGRIPTNPIFNVIESGYGFIWEAWVNIRDLAANTQRSIMGDGNNIMRVAKDAVGNIDVKYFNNTGGAVAVATSDSSNRPVLDEWIHCAIINTGAGANNIYATCKGVKGVAATDLVASSASGNFNLGQSDDGTGTPKTPSDHFLGACAFFRVTKIAAASFPTATIDTWLAAHADSFVPGNTPCTVHADIRAALNAGAAQMVSWYPKGLHLDGSTWYWDAVVEGAGAPSAAAMQATMIDTGATEATNGGHYILKGAYTVNG